MKKAVLLIALLTTTLLGVGQNMTTTLSSSVTIDTVTNTGTADLYMTATAPIGVLGFQLVVTKISGTVAGTAFLQASNDGTNFVEVNSSDSLALTNVATQSYLWTVGREAQAYQYYRILVTGSGTMAASITGYFKKRQ